MPSTVRREAPDAMTEYVSSAKASATSSCTEPEASATAAYHWPASVASPVGRPSRFCVAASRAAPPRMLASSSVRSASSGSPVSSAARPSVSARARPPAPARRRGPSPRPRAEARVDEVHRSVAARRAVARVEVPAGLRVGHGLEHGAGHAVLGRCRLEGALSARRVAARGRGRRVRGLRRRARQRQPGGDGCEAPSAATDRRTLRAPGVRCGVELGITRSSLSYPVWPQDAQPPTWVHRRRHPAAGCASDPVPGTHL